MKAQADNSFFIMSLARLGISFSIAEREVLMFAAAAALGGCLLTGVRLCIWNIIFYIAFLLD